MDGLGWVATIIVGGFAGWIASILLKVRNNIFMNIILGIVGAVVLNFVLVNLLKVPDYGGVWGQLVTGIIGAAIVMLIYRAVTGRNI